MLRALFLWLAGNGWLRSQLPRWRFARRAVRRFMPGEDADAALRAAASFQREGIATLLTMLGENVTQIAEADEVAEQYLALLERIAAERLDAEISLKLTQLGLDLDVERTFAHAKRLADRAAATGKTVWLDMEGSAYTEITIAFYERLHRAKANTGLCLQAYLRRTAADLERLLPLRPAIRLVKGAYAEPATIAFQDKLDVDRSYTSLAVRMLDAAKTTPGVRIALGTHDVRLVGEIAAQAQARGVPRSAFEIEMLYGIRVDEQRRLAREGFVVRDLISYGTAWYPWYMRRLAERPANVVFVLRQLLP